MRIQLELSPERVSKLKSLMSELEIDNYKDLFNNALSVFDWIVEETRKGREIASVNENEKKYKVLVVPALRTIVPTENRVNGSGSVAAASSSTHPSR